MKDYFSNARSVKQVIQIESEIVQQKLDHASGNTDRRSKMSPMLSTATSM